MTTQIAVFYMGKAGSSTVIQTCKQLDTDTPRCYNELPVEGYNHVISLARDPIARNISAFFAIEWERLQAYKEYDPQLLRYFLEMFPQEQHNRPLVWFDEVFKPATGIDIYATKFPKTKGYDIYEGERHRVLVIKTKDLEAKLAKGLVELLGLPDDVEITVEHRPRGQDVYQAVAGLYTDFLDSVVMPKDYIERMYESKYANHFYSKAALNRLAKRWGK